MVRILYGVSGEGGGHASRAQFVLRHLVRSGHEVRVATYDRGLEALSGEFEVVPIAGLTIGTRENEVSLRRTLLENLGRLPDGVRRFRALIRQGLWEFEPQVVLTDFEPQTAYLAAFEGLPLVTLDNQHRMRYMRFPCPPELDRDRRVARAVIRAMVPRPDVSLVTTFYFGEVLNDRTHLVPPILREEVRRLAPSAGEHVLVYATKAFDSLPEALRACPEQRFRVYGFEAGLDGGHARSDANLEFRPRGTAAFLEDLATCRGVIATAGFTLISEALHLRKPMLALPIKGQFEQQLNALLLEALGGGVNCAELNRAAVGEFLGGLPRFQSALEAYQTPPGSMLLGLLDDLLADEAAGAIAAREARRS